MIVVVPSFHYDFHTGDKPMVLQDLKTIKKEMDRIISANHAITSEVVSKEEARSNLHCHLNVYLCFIHFYSFQTSTER